MDDYSTYCRECRRRTEIVFDHSSGDTICSACGLVLDSHFVDECIEWRTFSHDNNSDNDPNRVGGPSNPLLTHHSLLTTISAHSAKKADFVALKMQNHVKNQDSALVKVFAIISVMADRLGVPASITSRANEIFKIVDDQKFCKRRNLNLNPILAACLSIACKENNVTRTWKEMAGVAEGITVKDFLRAEKIIMNLVDAEMGPMPMNIGEIVRRFCSNLGMKNQAVKAVQEAVETSAGFDIRRNPKSVLAAIIYIINQLSDDKRTLKDISVATEVAEGTIKRSYKDVYPHASTLVPNWFAKEEDIKKLCSP